MAEEKKWRPEGGDEEEEDEADELAYKSAKDAVLFAIEVSPSMMEPPPRSDSKKADRDSPTSAALKCAYYLMQQRIISHPSDMMGILLYGTEQTKFRKDEQSRGGLAYPHCYLLTDLDIPAAEDVKFLRDLVEDEEEFAKLMVPSKEPVSMANVLFCANQIFTTKAPNFASRRLFIVTDNDNPHEKNKALKSSAAVRAKDLYDLGVIIELFPISKPDGDFDRTKFYNDIVYTAAPSDPEAPASQTRVAKTSSTSGGISLLNSLLSSIDSKAVAKRALFSNVPFEIGPGLKVSVKGYIMFKRQLPQRTSFIWIEGEKAQIAKGSTTQMADDTAQSVDKVAIKKAYKFGGEQIAFTPEEINSLRYFGDPCIRIIGFKPQNMLEFWANTKPSTFIYPSEDGYVGSTRVFSALQQKLLKDDKMGVAWFIPRKNAAPVLAAILPGAEKLNEEGEQLIPPGMWIVPLPFADDIRQNPEVPVVEAPESLIDAMRLVIQQLQLPKAQYFPEKYPNPALQWHYRILQALALEEDIPEEPADNTVPKFRQIYKRAGSYVEDWMAELDRQHSIFHASNRGSTTLTKRPAPSAQDGAEPRKKVKVEKDPAMSDAEMRRHFEKNTIEKLTVVVLKGWLESKNLNITGKKADLVADVETYFETK